MTIGYQAAREELAVAHRTRQAAQERIERIRDALHRAETGKDARSARRIELQTALGQYRSQTTAAAVEAAVSGCETVMTELPETVEIRAEILALDAADRDADELIAALRARRATEQESASDWKFQDGMGRVISNSPATIALVKETREAWLRAIAGAKSIKYLIDLGYLDAGSVGEAAGTAPMKSVTLLSFLEHNSEAKRQFPDHELSQFGGWSDAVHALKIDPAALLPGEKAAKAPGKGLFG